MQVPRKQAQAENTEEKNLSNQSRSEALADRIEEGAALFSCVCR